MGRFERYEFVQKIAVGGMAEVWSAVGVGADGSVTDVVVKRILPEFASDEQFQNMLLEEAEVTARLQHANIVQVFDSGHLDETCFLAMERVVGLDGRQLLDASAMRKAPIPPAVALFAMGEIFKGLDYAHRRTDERGRPLGIVHRDVSPSNVLLSVTGEVKLADFGIARAKSRASHTMVGQVRGKPRYMSPEQAKGEELDGRSDLFAAGLVLHEFLTGQPVFPSSSYLEEVIATIERGVPPPSKVNSAVPADLDPLVLALCERDLERRFESGAAAYDAIMEWASRRMLRLHGGAVAELVTSIVRPAQAKRPPEAKGETRIVRIDDAAGIARFATQGKMLNPDLMLPPVAPASSPPGIRRAPVRKEEGEAEASMPRTRVMQMPPSAGGTGGIAGVSAAVLVAIALAVWWVYPRDLVQTGLEDDDPVPTLELSFDAGALAAATPHLSDPTPVESEPSFAPDDAPDPLPIATSARIATPRPPPATRRPKPTPTRTAEPAPATPTPTVEVVVGPGFLTLRSRPNGEVTIDGQWAGSTPLAKHQLLSGEHTVVVHSEDGRTATEKVIIVAGETTTLSLKLK